MGALSSVVAQIPGNELASKKWERRSMVPGAVGVVFLLLTVFSFFAFVPVVAGLLIELAIDSHSKHAERWFVVMLWVGAVMIGSLLLSAVFVVPYKLMELRAFAWASRERERRQTGHCARCNYSLGYVPRGDEWRCPECGNPQRFTTRGR